MSWRVFRPGVGRLVCVAVLAVTTARCSQTPTSPSTSGGVLSRGSVPQSGPEAPGDSLGPVNAAGATHFVAFGDSITTGVLSSFDGGFLFDPGPFTSYPYQLAGLLEANFTAQNFDVDNYGVPGEWAAQAISSNRLSQTLAAERPQGLLLLEGINDLNNGRSVSQVVGSLQQMIEIARLYNATVLIGTMFQTCLSVQPGTGTIRGNSADKIVAFNNAITAMAAGRQNVYVVDLFGAFGNNCGPDGGVNLLGADGLHPSTNGYVVMATTFGLAIRDRFPVRGSFQ
jgi:lysophospholipase L1-like esterase